MTQDQNRRRTSQGSDQPGQYREQQPPYEQQRAGWSPDQHQGESPPGVRGEQPRGEFRSPSGGTHQGNQGQSGGRQSQGPHESQYQSPPRGQQPHQQGARSTQRGAPATGGQFEQGAPGTSGQPPQRQPPQTGGEQLPQSSQGTQPQTGQGQQLHSMGTPGEQSTGTQPRGQMGGPPQGQMGGQPQGGIEGQTRQSMGTQPGQPMGIAGGTTPRRLPVEPVGAGDIAEIDVVTAERDDPLTSIVERMADEDVGTVVITEDDRPTGIVTDRMIALALAEHPDVSELTAGDVMTGDPVTVTDEMTVFEVVQTLGDSGIRRVPIVDDDGQLVGIVSIDDVLVLLATELDQLSEVVERQIERF